SAGLPMTRLSFTPAPSVAGTPTTFLAMYRICFSGIRSVGQRSYTMCGRRSDFQAAAVPPVYPVRKCRSYALANVPAVDFFANRIYECTDESHCDRIRRLAVHLAFARLVKQAGPQFGQRPRAPGLRHGGAFFDRSPVPEAVKSQCERLDARPNFLE